MAPTRAEVQRLWWALMVPLRVLAAHRLMLSSCLWFHTSISVNICDHASLVGACEWCLSLIVICYPFLLFVVVVFPKYFSLHSFYRPAFGCILTPLFAKSFLCEVSQPGKHVVMMRPDLLSCSCWLQTSLFHCPSPPPISLIISRSLGRHRREPSPSVCVWQSTVASY